MAVAIAAIGMSFGGARRSDARSRSRRRWCARSTASRTSRPRTSAASPAGYAYAFAEDNLCTIASEYVTVNGKRSRYFGPDENWTFSGNGTTYENIDADIYFSWVKQQGIVEELMKQPAPIGPKRGVKKGVAGYVKGYNAYLSKTGVDNLPDPRCAAPTGSARSGRSTSTAASSSSASSRRPAPRSRASPPPSRLGAAEAAEQQAVQDEMLADGSALSKLRPRSARTRTPSARRRPRTAAASSTATRTSPGTAPSASTRPTSRSPARWMSRARRSTACRWS